MLPAKGALVTSQAEATAILAAAAGLQAIALAADRHSNHEESHGDCEVSCLWPEWQHTYFQFSLREAKTDCEPV